MTLTQQWGAVLEDMIIRHPNGEQVVLNLTDDTYPVLMFSLEQTRDSRDPEKVIKRFVISNVRLTYFPGVDLAQKWVAAAWAGYIQHEALELVTVGDYLTRPLCPHADTDWNRGLMDGLPPELTPETLRKALETVMSPSAAEKIIASQQ